MGPETNNTLPTGQSAASNQPLDLLSDLESRLGQLKDWQAQTDQQFREMEEERQRIEALRDEAEQLKQACEERQQSFDAEAEQLNQQRQELDQQREQIENERAGLVSQAEALADERAEIEKSREQADYDLEAAEASKQQAAQQHEQLKSRLSELETKEQTLESRFAEIDQRQAELDQQQALLSDERESLNQTKESLEQQQQELDIAREQLDAERSEIEQARATISEQRAQLEADQAAVQQERDGLAGERSEIERKRIDQKLRAESLEAQQQHLEQARNELVEQASKVPNDADEKIAELQQAKAELEQAKLDLESRHAELEHSRSELTQLDEQLNKRQVELDDKQAALEQVRFELSERAQKIEEQAEQNLSVPGFEDLTQRETKLLEETEALESREEALEAKRADLEEKREQFKQTLEQSRQQIEAERQKVREREAKVAELERSGSGMQTGTIADVETEQANALRRERLQRCRELLKQRKQSLQNVSIPTDAPVNEATTQIAQGLEKERQMLIEVKRFLEASEGEMVRRWAATRAGTMVMGAIFTLVIAAGASYMAVQQIVTPVWEATMSVNVKPPADEPAPSDEAFLKQFEQTLYNEQVLDAALIEMGKGDASVRVATTPKELKAYLREHLTIESKPGGAKLALQTEDKEQAVPVMAALGKSLVGYNTARDFQAKRDPSTSIALPANLLSKPVNNDNEMKLKIAGSVFGGIVLLALFAYLFLRLMLNRSKRMFSEPIEQLTMLDKPETWSPLHAPSKEDNI